MYVKDCKTAPIRGNGRALLTHFDSSGLSLCGGPFSFWSAPQAGSSWLWPLCLIEDDGRMIPAKQTWKTWVIIGSAEGKGNLLKFMPSVIVATRAKAPMCFVHSSGHHEILCHIVAQDFGGKLCITPLRSFSLRLLFIISWGLCVATLPPLCFR